MYNKYGILKDNEEGANEIKALKEQLSKCWCYGQELNEYDNNNYKVTQDNECSDKETI
jgi:ABC-type transporter MlaC component